MWNAPALIPGSSRKTGAFLVLMPIPSHSGVWHNKSWVNEWASEWRKVQRRACTEVSIGPGSWESEAQTHTHTLKSMEPSAQLLAFPHAGVSWMIGLCLCGAVVKLETPTPFIFSRSCTWCCISCSFWTLISTYFASDPMLQSPALSRSWIDVCQMKE